MIIMGDETRKYYAEALRERMRPIERQFKVDMQQAQGINARRGVAQSGIQNREIARVIIERWRKVVEDRIDSRLETYRLQEITFDKADVEDMAEGFESARSGIINCYLYYGDGTGVANSLITGFEQVNIEARQTLTFEARKAAPKKRRKKKKSVKTIKNTVRADSITNSAIGFGGSSPSVSIWNPQVYKAAMELKKLIKESEELSDHKEDQKRGLKALNKLTTLAAEPKSESVISKQKEKLEVIKSVISIGKDLAIISMPYINLIAESFK
jgi:hypothetical protein